MNISWASIYVKDMNISKQFYCEVLGLKIKHEMSPKPGLNLCFLDGGNIDYELIEDANRSEIKMSDSVTICFMTESLDSKIKDLKDKGVADIVGPFQPSPHTRFIFIQDPNGMKIQIAEQL